MAAEKIDGVALAAIGAGVLLIYAGLTGKNLLAATRVLVSGKAPSAAAQAYPIAGGTAGTGPAAGYQGPAGAGGSPGQNQALAKLMASGQHPDWITGQQWSDWVALWNRESGWSQTADTRRTGAGGDNANSAVFAYGVPQARPYSKMPMAGWPPDKGGTSDPSAQIGWGIDYIASAYGNPSAAWAFEQANNGY